MSHDKLDSNAPFLLILTMVFRCPTLQSLKLLFKKTSVYQISNHKVRTLKPAVISRKNPIQIAKFTYDMCSLKIHVLPYLLKEKIVLYCTYLYSFFF